MTEARKEETPGAIIEEILALVERPLKERVTDQSRLEEMKPRELRMFRDAIKAGDQSFRSGILALLEPLDDPGDDKAPD